VAEAVSPARGTRPEGAGSETEASRKVREMFGRIAPRYDLLNHLLSGQMDRLWRRRTARRLAPILEQSNARVLDLCCGTGDLAMALARRGRAAIIGADFAHPMLVRARAKSRPSRSVPGQALSLFEADALALPFADCSFDLVTTAFGFRNLANYEAGLGEIRRVLKPGGALAILEFTEPPNSFLGNLYRWYFRRVLPEIGGIVSGDRGAYSYLPKSVSRFFEPQELASLLALSGFGSVEHSLWTFGTVALHTGIRLSP
jgi:demethylmenaquinone methyltransferase / 2-methoxy-6-polyprenyl-1,4-benzoquinol methylase